MGCWRCTQVVVMFGMGGPIGVCRAVAPGFRGYVAPQAARPAVTNLRNAIRSRPRRILVRWPRILGRVDQAIRTIAIRYPGSRRPNKRLLRSPPAGGWARQYP